MTDDRERWNGRWSAVSVERALTPPGALVEAADLLPTSGRSIDLAGGAGDGALWLAQRGLDSTLADVSDVALESARRRAELVGVGLTTVRTDLESEMPPAGPWDLITVFHYLNRDLLRVLGELLAPGGVVVVGIATRTNLERHERPSARFLLDDGELAGLLSGVTPLVHREDWSAWGIHEARFVGQRADGIS